MVSELYGRMLVLGAGSRSDAAMQELCAMLQHGRCGRAMEHGKAHLVTSVPFTRPLCCATLSVMTAGRLPQSSPTCRAVEDCVGPPDFSPFTFSISSSYQPTFFGWCGGWCP